MADETKNSQLTYSEQLLLKAKDGEDLTADERRVVIGFMLATPEFRDQSNTQMAKFFRVDEKTIRRDKDYIRAKFAEEITKDDIGLVIADVRLSYERYVVELSKAKKQAEPGTRVWLDYHNAEINMQLKVVETLQSLGYYPKNLGAMTTKKFLFVAEAARDGSVTTRQIDAADSKKLAAPTPKQLPAYFEDAEARAKDVAIYEADYGDDPLIGTHRAEDSSASGS